MDDKRSLYRDKFNFFANCFTAMVSIGIAVYAIYIAGGIEAMTQPLPPIVLVAFALAFIAAVAAFINWQNMRRTPKDTRLDDLIKAVNQLKSPIEEAKANREDSKPKINIEFKIDMADISKMNTEQLQVVSDIIRLLQAKATRY